MHERIAAADKAQGRIIDYLPHAETRYKTFVDALSTTLETDIPKSREALKAILGGTVKLYPAEGHLEAEMVGNYAAMLTTPDAIGKGLNSRREINLVAEEGLEPPTQRI